jgi:hypothetical protein
MSDDSYWPSEADLLAIMDNRIRELRANKPGAHLNQPVDWFALFKHEPQDAWVVQDLWPKERSIHIHAAPKTGKSLVSLWLAAHVAMGIDPITMRPITPMRVGYLDYEMTEDDLLERIQDMGITPEQLGATASDPYGNLRYFTHPVLPPLDTRAGGEALMEHLTFNDCHAVVLDTFSRVVEGEENSADTYRAFYRHTGSQLKHAGIAMSRLDHEGHANGRSRGSSAKIDDVDVVWGLKRTDDGLKFTRTQSRIAWVPETLTLRQVEPLGFVVASQSVPAGTLERVRELDALNIPIGLGRVKVRKMLIEMGAEPGRNEVLGAAIKYRNNRIFDV